MGEVADLNEDDMSIGSLTHISDFWKHEDVKQGLASTNDSEYNHL